MKIFYNKLANLMFIVGPDIYDWDRSSAETYNQIARGILINGLKF